MKYLLITACAALVLAACAGTVSQDNIVIKRAETRIGHVLSGEYLKAYEFLSPGYRSSVSREQYVVDFGTRKVKWLGAEILSAECGDELCRVKVKIDYRVNSPVSGIRTFDHFQEATEIWVKSGGQWWYAPDL